MRYHLTFVSRCLAVLFVFSACVPAFAAGDFWCPMEPPYGYAPSPQIEVNSKGHIFCLSTNAEMYRSLDNGHSWKTLSVPLSYRLKSAGDALVRQAQGGLYRSSDEGDTWVRISPYDVTFKTTTTGTIALIAGDSLHISFDRGDTWTVKAIITNEPANYRRNISGFALADNGDVYVQCRYISKNEHGESISVPDRLFAMAKDADTCQQILTGSEFDVVPLAAGNGDLYVTFDTNSISRCDLATGKWFGAGQFGNTLDRLRLMPDGVLYFRGDNYLSYSTDKGGTWEIGEPLSADKIVNMTRMADGRTYISTGHVGLFTQSTPQEPWKAIGSDMAGVDIQKLLSCRDGSLVAATRGNSIYRSDSRGLHWHRVPMHMNLREEPYLYVYDIARDDNGDMYAAAGDHGVFVSTDDGNSWYRMGTGYTSFYFSTLTATADKAIVAGNASNSGVSLIRSTSSGMTWTPVLNSEFLKSGVVYSILRGRGQLVFASTGQGIARSTDDGHSWSFIGTPAPGVNQVFDLAVDGTRLFVVAGGGVYVSEDDGNHWSSYGLSGKLGMKLLHTSDGELIATAGSGLQTTGIYKTSDDGATWQDITAAANGVYDGATCLVETADGRLYAGTTTGEFYRACTVATGVGPAPAVPEAVLACSFDPSGRLSVEYSLPLPGRVVVKLVDLMGREVAVVCDEWVGAGTHTCQWAQRLHAGVYFVVLNASGASVAQPVYCR